MTHVHNQVARALKRYDDLIKSERLVILGAVLDLKNELKFGNGKIIVINHNGSKDQIPIDDFVRAARKITR